VKNFFTTVFGINNLEHEKSTLSLKKWSPTHKKNLKNQKKILAQEKRSCNKTLKIQKQKFGRSYIYA
jgi:hypothetical protein